MGRNLFSIEKDLAYPRKYDHIKATFFSILKNCETVKSEVVGREEFFSSYCSFETVE
jgi:hypothetical protein